MRKHHKTTFQLFYVLIKNIVVVIQEKKVAMSQLTMHKTRGLLILYMHK